MPTHSQTSVGSLPDIDEATAPFSSLFDNNFDRATVEATVPLADRAIFVAANGRRFKFESLPDGDVQGGRQSEDQRSPTRDYGAPNTVSAIRRRPVSGLSTGLQHHASGRGAPEAMRLPGYADPRDAAEDLAPTMAQLNIHRFSATPFFADSDGGVLAAETLTDLDPSPRLPIPPSPTVQTVTAQSPTGMSCSPNYQASSYTPQPYLGGRYPSQPPLMTTALAAEPNYGYHSPPPNTQYQGTRHPSLPSLVGQSSPVPYSTNPNAVGIPPLDPYQRASYYQPSTQSHPGVNFGSAPRNGSSPAISYLNSPQHDEERRRSEGNSYYGPMSSPPPQTQRLYNIPTGESHFDTQTPVVVIPGSRPQSRQHQGSTSSRSDGASTGRDNVLPGEDVLFDG
jgi:hypothetical protein